MEYVIAFIAILAIYFLPAYFAFKRDHAYKNIILILNIFGFSGVTWIIAMIWAVYPSDKSIIDPVIGNVTGTSERNVGHTLGDVDLARKATAGGSGVSSSATDESAVNNIEKLAKLLETGAISRDEFEILKSKYIKQT